MNLLQLFPDVWNSTQKSFNISEGKSSQVGIIYTFDEKHENTLIIFYNFLQCTVEYITVYLYFF